MLDRIVVPLDGSLTAEAILPHVRRMLYRHDSEVILVRAVEPPMVEAPVTVTEAQLGAAREYILGQRERLERSAVRVRQVVQVGSPVGVILDAVEEQKATMIAMATHGTTGVARFLFGSVAEGVLRRSPVPVLTVRPFWSYELAPAGGIERRPIRNVLLPVDGSDLSIQSLQGVIEFADLFETRIVLLRVLEEKKKEDRAEAEKQLRALAKSIEKQGVETLSLVEKGDPVDQILKAVRFNEVDLVAMTTHGRSGISRAVTGSVTEAVLRRATVPLLVTRSTNAARAAKRPRLAGLRK